MQIRGYEDESEFSEQELWHEIIRADKYFFFESNIEFHDDGTRYSESEARLLSMNHLQAYAFFGILPEMVTASDRYKVIEQYVLNKITALLKDFAKENE